MVDCHYGVLTDGVFNSSDGSGYATSGPVQVNSLPSGASAIVHVKGKASSFSLVIVSSNTINCSELDYSANSHAAFHYVSFWGRVNSDAYFEEGEFAVHRTRLKAPFTATLTLRGSDRTVSFSVNGVPQRGVWALPATDAFYLMLGTFDGEVVVTDVTVANLVQKRVSF